MKKVFIDGSAGTTGLRIQERLRRRTDIELIILPENLRKDPLARKQCLHNADIAILCLPDAEARWAVSVLDHSNTIIIDASTAHRTNENFVYGFSELTGRREKIKNSSRIANPGCHAIGIISLVAPLRERKILSSDLNLSCFSITGYSGGGKRMIVEYESNSRNNLLNAPRIYGVTQNHKHLPEIKKECDLHNEPIFCPMVAPYYSGMQVVVPIFAENVMGNIDDIKHVYSEYYTHGLVHFEENAEDFLSACKFAGYDDMRICVCGDRDRILLISQFDNLGKGASGSVIQNMNIILGVDESCGLSLKY